MWRVVVGKEQRDSSCHRQRDGQGDSFPSNAPSGAFDGRHLEMVDDEMAGGGGGLPGDGHGNYA